jgi:hypothetical protein
MYGPDNKKGNYDNLLNVNNKKFEENKKLQKQCCKFGFILLPFILVYKSRTMDQMYLRK